MESKKKEGIFDKYVRALNEDNQVKEDVRLRELIDIKKYNTAEKVEEYIGLNIPEVINKVNEEMEFNLKEKEELTNLNMFADKLYRNLDKMQESLQEFNFNINQSEQLMDIWSNVLTNTIHNQSFLFDLEWQGGREDERKLTEIEKQEVRESAHYNQSLIKENYFDDSTSFLVDDAGQVIIPSSTNPDTLERRNRRKSIRLNRESRLRQNQTDPDVSI